MKQKVYTNSLSSQAGQKDFFWKIENNKQTHCLNKWVAEGTSTTTQLRLTTPCVTTLGTMIRQRVNLYVWIHIYERQDIGLNHLLDFDTQRKTVLNVMTWCPLMEGTWKVRSIRTDNLLGNWGGALVMHLRKQLCIFHRNQIILWHPLNTIMQGEQLGSLLSRLLLISLLKWLLGLLLKLRRILRNCQRSYQGTQLL